MTKPKGKSKMREFIEELTGVVDFPKICDDAIETSLAQVLDLDCT